MKLFHISKGIDNEIKEFIPRVPERRLDDENSTIKRVCLSTSIDNCILAIPDSTAYLPSYHRGMDVKLEHFITIYEVD